MWLITYKEVGWMFKKNHREKMPKKGYGHAEPKKPKWYYEPEEDEKRKWCYEPEEDKKHKCWYDDEEDKKCKWYPEDDREPKKDKRRKDDMMPKKYYEPDDDYCPSRDDDKKDFCQLVEEAITDEIGAVSMYAAMANMVDDPLLRALILNIAGDEYGHAKFWLAVLALSDC